MNNEGLGLGFAGRLAKQFLNSKLTPLLVIVALMMGVFAIIMTPKEEEPQIKVPMIDIVYQVPGFSAKEIEKRVSSPLERSMSSLSAVKHVFSTSMESVSLITVQFEVGEDLETSLIKVHHTLQEAINTLPEEIKQFSPTIKSYTIDEVPFYTITFFSNSLSSSALREMILPQAKKMQEISGISTMNIIGGAQKIARITPQLSKMNDYGLSLIEMKQALEKSTSQYLVGPIRERSKEPILVAGSFISNIEDIKSIPLGRRSGGTVVLADIADISIDYDKEKALVFHTDAKNHQSQNAITVEFTKKKGTNATILAESLKKKLDQFSSEIKDKNIAWEITRDYGQTAKEKTTELIEHLLLATLSVMILVAFVLGFRVSLVVGITVPVTLAMTILVYYLLGYTLNRVTLFALIFSIGILVDDAIVVVENIYRHLSMGSHKAKDLAITAATDEVGGPTILATFTVIMAIMPMAFVGGLMGPYMRPIPIGASVAMLFSLFIAFIVSPWAAKRLIKVKATDSHQENTDEKQGLIAKIFTPTMEWIISSKKNSAIVFVSVILMLLASIFLIISKQVKVKMLPFDNKSEFQVLIDMPPGTSLGDTKEFSFKMIEMLKQYPEVKNIQTYVGAAAPFNFSGMVKHTFLRSSSYRADLQVNLVHKNERKMQGHDLVKKIRTDIMAQITQEGIKIKFLEVPPGPPVLSTVLAEIYHPNEKKSLELTKQVENIYRATEGIVEVDTTLNIPQDKLLFDFDRNNGKVHGVPQSFVSSTLLMSLADLDLFALHQNDAEEPIFMRLALPNQVKENDEAILSLLVPSLEGDKIPLKKLVHVVKTQTEQSLYHKDLRPVHYVMGEVSGLEESPSYAIAKINKKLDELNFNTTYLKAPPESDQASLKWDGEMDITLEVFRDLGLAFFIAVVLIMILIIGWYNSFTIPLLIVLPIPLTLIGIIPGHMLFNSFFTATSMIGFIAGAGITVRNSIILVDFIEERRLEGHDCKKAVIESTIIRFRPILLTALAVIVAAIVILFDPIFQGLAISLMMGALVSSLLSIPLVPVLYYWFRRNKEVTKGKNISKGIFDYEI